jgi:hypothetical protein
MFREGLWSRERKRKPYRQRRARKEHFGEPEGVSKLAASLGIRALRWVYRKMRNGQPWHLRGVDIFTVRDGKVSAKLAYVKG